MAHTQKHRRPTTHVTSYGSNIFRTWCLRQNPGACCNRDFLHMRSRSTPVHHCTPPPWPQAGSKNDRISCPVPAAKYAWPLSARHPMSRASYTAQCLRHGGPEANECWQPHLVTRPEISAANPQASPWTSRKEGDAVEIKAQL